MPAGESSGLVFPLADATAGKLTAKLKYGLGDGATRDALAQDDSDHVRLYHHDAVEVLTHEIADGSLDEVRIYFPDPWHKKRHNKRRLVQPEFARLIVAKLAPGGRLHLATDWQDYAEQMWDVLDATPGIVNRAGERGSVPRPAM